eukprot:5688899-Prymnesium_polylepis.1
MLDSTIRPAAASPSLDALAAACAWRGLPVSGRKHDVAARLAKSLERGRDEVSNPEAGLDDSASGSGPPVLRTSR